MIGACASGTSREEPTPGLSGIPKINPKYRMDCDRHKPKQRVGKDARQLIYEYNAAVDLCDGDRRGAVAHSDSIIKHWPK